MSALLTTLTLQVAVNITHNGTTGGYVSLPVVHAAYKIHEELATWNEARERCMSEGAHLAIADSLEKIVTIRSLRNQSDHWLHVGIYNLAGTDQWVGVDDDLPVSPVSWAYGKPNRSGTCAGISMFRDGLVDYRCNGKREYFVCESRITEDNNATESSVSGLTVTQCTPHSHTATLPDGYVAYPDVGAAYKVAEKYVTWKQARKLCFEEGAQLALIDSVKKINYIKEMTRLPNSSHAHVGIHRFEGEWLSVRDGAVVVSIPWASGQPVGNDSYNCARLNAIAGVTGLFNQICNGWNSHRVCELPIPTSYSINGNQLSLIAVN